MDTNTQAIGSNPVLLPQSLNINQANQAVIPGALKPSQPSDAQAIIRAQIEQQKAMSQTSIMSKMMDQMFSMFNSMLDKLFGLIDQLSSKLSGSAETPAATDAAAQAATGAQAGTQAADQAAQGSAGAGAVSNTKTKQTEKPSDQFLWKPESEKDGKLVILTPSEMTGKVKSVRIVSPNGKKLLARGKNTGVGNGNREHFRFSKTGAEFPKGSRVEILLKDNTIHTIKIGNPDQRITK